jgi:hypothetical protein
MTPMTAAAVMPMTGFAARWVIGACWVVGFEGVVGFVGVGFEAVGERDEFVEEVDRVVGMAGRVEEEGKLAGERADEVADSSWEI